MARSRILHHTFNRTMQELKLAKYGNRQDLYIAFNRTMQELKLQPEMPRRSR